MVFEIRIDQTQPYCDGSQENKNRRKKHENHQQQQHCCHAIVYALYMCAVYTYGVTCDVIYRQHNVGGGASVRRRDSEHLSHVTVPIKI